MKYICKAPTGLLLLCFILLQCASIPVKKYYVINYEPVPMTSRLSPNPYPCVIRIKEFDIEEAYSRPQIVYRKSPYELLYYYFRVWAVKPTKMITDMVEKHLVSTGLVSHVVRRFDEGFKPDYELTGNIEALEEYDNEDIWWAHLSIRFEFTRLRDRQIIYSQSFDKRKRVFQYNPEDVIRELSQTMDFIMSQVLNDIDSALAKEYDLINNPAKESYNTSTEKQDSISPGDKIE
ncbi:MAG: ABC-type transport auxiliary lipoprotein family protein [Chitinispirillia bacterium]|jgi:ABC-type uncharacterized transport system auxiliary subunit